jgi:hypothetical protein
MRLRELADKTSRLTRLHLAGRALPVPPQPRS